MKISHIYLFSSFNTQGVSTRYRGTYMLAEMKDQCGINHSFVYPGYKPKEILGFLKTYISALVFRKRNSLIIFQKLHSNGLYTFLLKILLWFRPKNTIYDTDDADYIRFRDNNIHHFMCKCDVCTVGSTALANYAGKRNENVLLLSSPMIRHDEVKTKRNKILHIGWVGDYGMNSGYTAPYSHKISLKEILFPILHELSFEFKLTILGVKNPTDKLEIETFFKDRKNIRLNIPMDIDWLDEINIYRMIKDFDIGVSPMVNHDFNIAKSAFKAKQYLSCGVPVLASPVGENLKLIKDAYNGYICNNSEDFKSRIIEINDLSEIEYDKLLRNAFQGTPEFRIDNYCRILLSYFISG